MARSKPALSANLNAFLDSLAWAEGTSISPITKDDGYDIIVTGLDGPERFDNYSYHPFSKGRPSKIINRNGLSSNAAGRYQFMLRDYDHYKSLLTLEDFGPLSQDRWAVQLLREAKALAFIEFGKIEAAVAACRHLWASLPGASYGQPERKLSDFKEVYLTKGGKLWDSAQSLPGSLAQSSQLQAPTLPVISEAKPLPTQPLAPTLSMPNQSGLLNLILKLLRLR